MEPADPETQPGPGDPAPEPAGAIATRSLSVAKWTLVSRVAGVVRVAVISAVLGPTFFGNAFQAVNLLPNLTYEFLTGSLFTALLVPSLVRHVDGGDREAAERVAGGFLGVALLAFGAVTALVIVLGPIVVTILTVGIDDPSVLSAQRRVGLVLLVMLMPQVILYGIAATGGAVMNAHGRFALAAAAPAFESLGVVVTMGLSAVLFGTTPDIHTVATPQLVLLGLGTTAAVGLHAGAQWWGALRVGVRLRPRAGWRDPEVCKVIRRAVPSLGYAGMNSLRVFAVLVVANRVAGGVVAFRLAVNFFQLPIAVWVRPVAVAGLAQLSRLHQAGAVRRFKDELVRGAALVFFLIVPATVGFAVLARPIARVVSFGAMATPSGVLLVSASLAALALGILGEAAFVVLSNACYARHDAHGPLRSMMVRTSFAVVGIVVAFFFVEGTAVVVALGLAISAGNIVSAQHLFIHLRRQLPPADHGLRSTLVRAGVVSVVMWLPAYVIAEYLPGAGAIRDAGGLALAGVVAVTIFLAVHTAWRSPELRSLLGRAVTLPGRQV